VSPEVAGGKRPCAVLGAGAMGSALVRSLLAAGHPTTVWNRTTERCAPLAELGASVATSVASAIAAAEIVFVVVRNSGVSAEVLATAGVDAALARRTLVEFSVGDPAYRIGLEAWCAERGARYLGGSIRGYPSEIGTDRGIVNFWGTSAVYADAEPVLDVLGEARYLGPDIEAEEALAAIGPVLSACLVSGFFEAAAYVAAHGVPLSRLLDQLALSNKIAVGAAEHAIEWREAEGGGEPPSEAEGTIETWLTSVDPLVEAMRAAGIEPRTAEASLADMRAAIDAGYGLREIDALIEVVSSGVSTGAV
jgi:3-hydroxyisobutyrate dehydrogenase-like beta-hydroxyacid dehydrogenase